MQEGLFSDYFSCPIIYVEGRCFPVEQHYLPDINKLVAAGQREVATERGKPDRFDIKMGKGKDGDSSKKNDTGKGLLGQIAASEINAVRPPRFDAETVAETVIRIIQTYSKRDRTSFISPIPSHTDPVSISGDAILVFLSGIQQIEKVNRALRQRHMTSLKAQVHILHGSLPPERQRRVFKKSKPGEWKIVLSTNIAETSVTVEDITHVVDCGMVKVTLLRFLKEIVLWISLIYVCLKIVITYLSFQQLTSEYNFYLNSP
jgi:ATP-dependent RNA helicase DHX57